MPLHRVYAKGIFSGSEKEAISESITKIYNLIPRLYVESLIPRFYAESLQQ